MLEVGGLEPEPASMFAVALGCIREGDARRALSLLEILSKRSPPMLVRAYTGALIVALQAGDQDSVNALVVRWYRAQNALRV